MKFKVKMIRTGEWFFAPYQGLTRDREKAFVFDTKDERFGLATFMDELVDKRDCRLVYVWEKKVDLTELVTDYDPEPQFNAIPEGGDLEENWFDG